MPRKLSSEDRASSRRARAQRYSAGSYRRARAELVRGRACLVCGETARVQAHHVIQADDRSIVPLCPSCHRKAHTSVDYKPAAPPSGEPPPACACGCGRPVAWKRHRGWARFVHGHHTAKQPVTLLAGTPPLCACGCGTRVIGRYGRWNKFVRGHNNASLPAGSKDATAPLCACGCGLACSFRHGRGWSEFRRGHFRRGRAGDKR